MNFLIRPSIIFINLCLHNLTLKLPLISKSLVGENFFAVCVVPIWNKLLNKIVDLGFLLALILIMQTLLFFNVICCASE